MWRLHVKPKDSLWAGRVPGIGDLSQELWVIFDELGGAPDLDPMTVRVVHEEQIRLIVLTQIANRDVL